MGCGGIMGRAMQGLICLGVLLAAPALADQRAVAEQVMRDLGLPAGFEAEVATLPRPALPVLALASAEIADLQAALTQVAILSGANDLMAIVKAQPKEGGAIYLRQGGMTLPELANALQTAGQTGLELQDGTYHLTRPLIIWSDARLALNPGERLVMDRASGAFLIGFGDLVIDGAAVAGTEAMNAQSPDFAPFVLVAGQGTLWAQGSNFQGLGMAQTKLFGGVTVLAKGLIQPKFPALIQSNQFQDVARISLIGADAGRVEGNRIAGAILVEGGTGQMILRNDVQPGSAGAGIRVAGAAGVTVAGNLVEGGAATGIAASRGITALRIAGNIVTDNAGDGISLSGASCAQVQGNLLADNGAVGLRLEGLTATEVAQNAILHNGTAAIDLRDQAVDAGTTVLRGNILADNGEGLRGASIGSVLLSANQLQDQLPRLFGGEFSAHLPAFLTATEQGQDDSFLITATAGEAQPAPSCARGL